MEKVRSFQKFAEKGIALDSVAWVRCFSLILQRNTSVLRVVNNPSSPCQCPCGFSLFLIPAYLCPLLHTMPNPIGLQAQLLQLQAR